jgi:AhpD family alkylhydroperoxidase
MAMTWEVRMARITGVPARKAGPYARLVYLMAGAGMSRLAGRRVANGIEPIAAFAHSPVLLRGHVRLEMAAGRMRSLDKRTRALAEIKTATMTHCEYCIDLGSQISRKWGLTDDELLALPGYQQSPLFSEVDKLVLGYAVAVSSTPASVSDELFASLRQHFDDRQIVELTYTIALENLRGRFNVALDIGAAGFSEGMVCAVPVSPPAVTA